MKTMRTRICAALCAAATFLLLMPATAFAATTMTGPEFVNSAKDGTITLEDDVILTSTVSIKQDVTINLNGHTLSRDTSDEKYLKVLLLDIDDGSVIINGEGTITGGEYGDVNLFSPAGIIDVSGKANLTVRGKAEVNAGAIASNGTIGDFRTINFSSEGKLTIEESKIVGLSYGNKSSAAAVYAYGKAAVEITKSTIIGGASGSDTSGNALELRTTGDTPAKIVDSVLVGGGGEKARQGGNGLYLSTNASAVVTGGTIAGGHGTSGGHGVNVAGSLVLDGVEISGGTSRTSTPGVGVYCTLPATTVDIKDCTVEGGSPAEGFITNSAGRGMEIYGPVQLTVENSSILGGNNNRDGGDIIGGNAIWFYDEDTINAKITLIDTVLDVGNEVANDAVISGNNNAPAGPNGKILANITAGGALTVNGGTLANTTITPAEGGLELVHSEDATVDVGKNQLTVISEAIVENNGRPVFFSDAGDAIQNAKPGSTVTITNVDENENLPTPPAGVEIENGTDSPILVGGQTVTPGESVASHVAKIGDKGYLSLEAALADAKAKDTIELLGSVDSSEAVTVPAGVTIDGNGHAINCTSVIANGAFVTAGDDGVTLKDLVVNTNGNAKHGVQFYCVDGGALDGASINGGSYTSVIINGATNIDIRNCTLTPDAGAYAHIEFAMGKNVSTVPSMTIQGTLFKGPETAAKVWIDNSTVESIKAALGNDTAIEQVIAHIKERIDNNDAAGLDIAIQTKPDSIENIVVGGYVPPAPEYKYAVTIAPVENGTVAADPENAAAGETVTIVATPAKGFLTESILVKDAKGALVETIAKDENSFTFEMPSSDATVAVTFACDGGASCPSHIFPDVDRAKWYHVAIDWAVSNEVMNGFESGDLAGLFGPEMNLTRAQMVQILWNLEGKPAATLASSFSDVSQDDWFYGAIAWAVSEGIYEGYEGSDLFGPNDSLTREQAAAVLMRWSEMQGEDVSARADLSAYPDADEVSGWAAEYLSWAVGADILHGIEASDGTLLLASQASATRAEAAMLMMRLAA